MRRAQSHKQLREANIKNLATQYRRTPLPEHAKTPVGVVALCFMSFILCPFVGFAIHGQVAEPGLVTGIWLMLIPVSALAVIALLRWHTWQRLPSELKAEWTSGRIIAAKGGPTVASPVRFSNRQNWIAMTSEELSFAPLSLLSALGMAGLKQWRGKKTLTIAWTEVLEWSVDTDSDGPDYYSLSLRSGGRIRLCRFLPDQSRLRMWPSRCGAQRGKDCATTSL